MSIISAETTLAAPIEQCFETSLAVETHVASLRSTNQAAVAGRTSGTLGLGDTVTWQARHFGISFMMTTGLSVLEPPHRFVEEQMRGPFARWRHEHTFERLSDHQTLMRDVIDFRSPLWHVGRLIDRCVVCDHMRRLLRIRNTWIALEVEYLGR